MAERDDQQAPGPEDLQQELHRWCEEHPQATLAEIEQALEEHLNRLRRRLLENELAPRGKRGASAACPACAGQCEARGQRERTLILPGDEQLRLERAYLVCQGCGLGRFPLDDVLELLPGSLSPRLQQAVVRLSTSLPFGQAAREVAWLLGVSVSERLACRLTEKAGTTSVALHALEVERVEREQPPPPAGPALQQVSADGAMVPLLHGQWAEVKTVAIGTVLSAPGPDGKAIPRATDISYFSRRTDHETFSRLALPEFHRRGTETATVVVGVMDGSEWLQKFLDMHRPDAVRILDFPHAVEHLAAAAQASLGAGTPDTKAWLDEQSTILRAGNPDTMLAALKALRTAAADPLLAEAARDNALAYFTKRREQIAYATFEAKGYPIGSGMVESANKLVVEARLKGSGMHWAGDHVDPMLSLRTSLCSGSWAETWRQIAPAQRTDAHTRAERRRRARHEARQPDPDTVAPAAAPVSPSPIPSKSRRLLPPKMVNGRPTADHPWRQPLNRHQAVGC
ncbi:MAG TPA: ISKra4 family transposase [Chloroflexota bacterium]|nr:ISKra4 family transposase [Chloroflexota bacterium]